MRPVPGRGQHHRVIARIFGDDAASTCIDIPDRACAQQPRNLSIHLASLTATKTGDGLLDPKLVLAWLMTAVGAPAAAAGLIVPLRESLALFPQLFIGHRVRRMPRRTGVWATASMAQGVVIAAIAAVAFSADASASGRVLGWLLVALIALFAFARSFASVTYKDVLGKTVSKTKRGTVSGTAGSIAAALVFGFGVLLSTEVVPVTTRSVGYILLVSAALFVLAGVTFSRLDEEPGAVSDGPRMALQELRLLQTDPQLARFIATRSLLTVTAIAPPYLLLATAEDSRAETLGPFVLASSLATVIGGRLWGRLSDRSSRRVLVGSAGASTTLFAIAGLGALVDERFLASRWTTTGLLFLVVLAYQGIRIGRVTHLVDMTGPDQRSIYTAVSNTIVGVVILAAGAFGALSDVIGLGWLFVSFAACSALAVAIGWGLDEVQSTTRPTR